MITTHKRGPVYHFCTYVADRRVRGSLGTKSPEIARKRTAQLEQAIQEGPQSETWSVLRLVMPTGTMQNLNRALVGPAPDFSLAEIEKRFGNYLDRQLQIGSLSSSTVNYYENRVAEFIEWLPVQKMDEVTPEILEEYVIWRKGKLLATPQATNGHGVLLAAAAIRKFLAFCVSENWMKPVKFPELRRSVDEIHGAEPFTKDELDRMEAKAEGIIRLAYLIFRWTGLRGSDVAALTWNEVDFKNQRIRRLTQKRKKLVVVPLAPVLADELQKWRDMLSPSSSDRVLPNMTREKLYRVMGALGDKSGVENAHPHRYRASFVVYLLENQVPIYEISKIVGDSVATLERAYSRFTDTMVDRVRKVFEDEKHLGN